MSPNVGAIRRESLPVIYVKGTHYEVGYDIGRTFGSLIHSYINKSHELQELLLLYESVYGKENYNIILGNVEKYYPQYIQELKGVAEGSNVPFYKLFLLHLADLLKPPNINNTLEQGCTTICVNEKDEEFLAHSEDALKDVLNHIYILNVHITESEPHQIFTALSYAGLIPGYSMGYNIHGFVYSINIIHAKHLNVNGIPRAFVARDLLSADTFEKVQTILKCKGHGIADAMSINFTFLNEYGDRLFHNIEVAPNYPFNNNESIISILTISPGEQIFHCNKLLHLKLPEDETYHESSIIRHKTKDSLGEITNKYHIMNMFGDTSHPVHNIFRDGNFDILTVAIGIFDLINKTWSLYIHNPKTSDPIVTLPLQLSK